LEYPVGKALFDAAGWVSHVRVSPDGRLVAFIDHPQKGDNIGTVRVIDANGSVPLNGPFSMRGVAWSPKGDQMVYEYAETVGDAYLLDARGGSSE